MGCRFPGPDAPGGTHPIGPVIPHPILAAPRFPAGSRQTTAFLSKGLDGHVHGHPHHPNPPRHPQLRIIPLRQPLSRTTRETNPPLLSTRRRSVRQGEEELRDTELATASARRPHPGADNEGGVSKSTVTDLHAGGGRRVFMVHAIDMAPGLASDGTSYADTTPPANLAKTLSYGGSWNGSIHRWSSEQHHPDSRRTSSDVPTPAVELLPGGWPFSATPTQNGSIKEGVGGQDGSILSVPNGQSRAASAKSVALSAKSRRSGSNLASENERRSGELGKDATLRPGVGIDDRQATAPGSYGKLSSAPRPGGGRIAAENAPLMPARSVSYGATPSTPVNALSPVKEASPALSTAPGAFTDDLLRLPAHTSPHRVSSPPAFNANAPPTESTAPFPLARHTSLQPGNTLDVPKINSRLSRESADHPSVTTDAGGRFSPTTPTRRHTSMQLGRKAARSVNSDVRVDGVPPDEDAARWTEHIKAKRAKKLRVDTDDERVMVGTKVDENHGNFVTAYNMLTGIRFCVSRTNAKLDRELTRADFAAKHKFSFDITGNELTPSAKYDFKFKDYAPWVFRHLRAMFQIDPAEYLMSLTAKYILSELGSPGKSGSFFYFSRDYKYIIKTIHHAEHKLLRKILPEYFQHVADNPDTLLSQFYGLHRVKIPYGRKIHFVVMNNLFPPHRDIHQTFDLKGSTVGRDYKEEDLAKNPRATLKDLNWLRRSQRLEFGPTKKAVFREQLRRDVALLQRLKIMDYSLLVGIHDLERGNEEKLRDKTLQVFQPGGDKHTDEPAPAAMGGPRPTRTPSTLDNAKRAKELREMVKKQRPVPMEQMRDKMPAVAHNKGAFYFYADDGGFRATHEDDTPGEEIYYLGIIDCLTRYNFVKKAEHFWKGMGGHESQISPIPPERYGDRFLKFISGTTLSRERAAQADKERAPSNGGLDGHFAADEVAVVDDDYSSRPSGGGGGRDTASPNEKGHHRSSSDHQHPRNTLASSESEVVEEAENAAEKTQQPDGFRESDLPVRALTTVSSPSHEGGGADTTLPVIGEANESVSNNSSSRVTPRRSREDLPVPAEAPEEEDRHRSRLQSPADVVREFHPQKNGVIVAPARSTK